MIQKIMLFSFIIIGVFSTQIFAQTTVQSADGPQITITDTSRIITIGGSITETVFALGAGDQVVAVDQSSTYPAKVHSLPKVPYIRRLSAEGILSLNPSLILAGDDASPKTAIQQLRAAGVPVLLVPTPASVDGAISKIKKLAEALGKQKKGKQLITDLRNKIKQAKSLRQQMKTAPKVMFILSIGQGSPMIAGKQTSAAKVIKMAGGKNAFNTFSGYKPVSAGSIAAANPDIILMMGNRLEGTDAVERTKQMPGISLTKAAKNNQIYTFDGNYLLGFGPRTGAAVLELLHIFYPKLNNMSSRCITFDENAPRQTAGFAVRWVNEAANLPVSPQKQRADGENNVKSL